MISVLCPTRGRFDSMLASFQSLASTGRDFELLLYVDDDDPQLDRYRRLAPTIIGPRHGYPGLHHYVNALADQARGDWLLLWNDDATMTTKAWDDMIHAQEPAVLSPGTNHGGDPTSVKRCIFPVVPTAWVRHVGHFSLNRHNDTWWGYIGRDLGLLRPIGVHIHHDRFDLTGGHDDETAQGREYDPAFFGDEVQRLIRADTDAIRSLL